MANYTPPTPTQVNMNHLTGYSVPTPTQVNMNHTDAGGGPVESFSQNAVKNNFMIMLAT